MPKNLPGRFWIVGGGSDPLMVLGPFYLFSGLKKKIWFLMGATFIEAGARTSRENAVMSTSTAKILSRESLIERHSC